MNSSNKFIKSVQYTLGWWDLVNSPTLDRKPLSEEDVSLMIAAGSIYFIVSVESSQQELLSLGKPPTPPPLPPPEEFKLSFRITFFAKSI